MGQISVALGLTLKVPTPGSTGWAQQFLDDFAKPISSHDHSGGGKGSQIGSGGLAAKCVTSAKIADGAVGSLQLGAAVDTANIVAKAVTAAKIADKTITSAQIADGTLATAQYQDGSVTAGKLATGAVNNAVLAAQAVTDDKLFNGAYLGLLAKGEIQQGGGSGTSFISFNSVIGSNGQLGFNIPFNFLVTHISCIWSQTQASGNYSVQVFKNGIATAASATSQAGNPSVAGAISQVSFAFTDQLKIQLTRNALDFGGNFPYLLVLLYGKMVA